MSSRVLCCALLGLLAMSGAAQAGIVVGGPGDAGVGDCVPFGCSDASIYQQIYSSTLFSQPLTISGLTFFVRNFDNVDPLTGGAIVPGTIYPANYTITMSVAPIAVNGLDPIVENNLDPLTSQIFFIGFLSDPVIDHFTITTTPANYFRYDPSQGNLLIDIRTDGSDPTLTAFFDVNSGAGGMFSSAFDSNPHPAGCPDGSAGITTGCVSLDYGLVTGFSTPDDLQGDGSTPEPATLWLGVSGLLWLRFRNRAVKKAS
jgi:hypothetical protein